MISRRTGDRPVFQERPYWYATGKDSAIWAYTREEWGLGGSYPSGGNYQARTVTGMMIATVLMTVPAIACPVLLLISIIALHPGMILTSLFFTLLSTTGWFLGIQSLKEEFAAKKLRAAKGLPKPRNGVTDDQARTWFERNGGGPAATKDNFPDSTRPFAVD